MKIIYHLFLCLLFASLLQAQPAGKIVSGILAAESLKNPGGENATRKISVYLPPGYETGNKRYPVIYYLHGFMGNDSIYPGMKAILDQAISRQKIRPFILVIADHFTLYSGSFYSNSALTGNWTDFTARDLTAYMDKNFRTIPGREGRGIAGHSMGGYGAIKTAMLYPEVFSSLYALSPGLLAFVKEFGPNSESFKQLGSIKNLEELNRTYYPRVLVAVARAWSPNLSNPPFYCDFPFTYIKDSLVVNESVFEKWKANMPVYMADRFYNNLRSLKAIKLDWGRNDAARFPIQIGMFSQRLENSGIPHFAEEYIGDHGNKIWSADGRVLNDLLPFFNDYLRFE